ncbi:hypothetical protein C8R47DRAFT_288439 [Mycena vitilis]|nr:hypothetical protein C8R47DRAFT_288439 [Mycena vitilis]
MKTVGLALDLIRNIRRILKHFHVHAAMRYPSVFALEVPLPVLCTFRITYAAWMGLPQCLQLLRNSPRLVKATLDLSIDADLGLPMGAMAIRASLQYLALREAAGPSGSPCVAQPCVRCWHFGSRIPRSFVRFSIDIHVLRGLAERLGDSDGLSLEWFHIMRNLTVVALDAVGPELTRRCLLALNRETMADLLPCLEVLEICQHIHNIDEPVIAALRSRYQDHEAQDGKS